MADVDNEITGACMNNNELTPFKVVDLKRYLANRKLNVSGLKCELIERIKGAYRLSITDKRVLEERDREERERRATERFILPCGEGLPPPSTLKAWKSTIDLFPAVEEKDIYNYIVLKRDSKRQLKARTYYVDGHVQKVEVHLISEECSHCYVQASVLPSFPTADKRKSPEYQPWILLSKVTGCIHSAFCNCPAGEGECCNHIGALLYGLEDLTRKKTLAPTSKPCAWNNFSMLSAPRKQAISTVVFIIAGILPTCIDLSFGGPVPNGNSDNQSPCFLIDKEGNLQNRSLADTVAHVSREVEGARIGISMAKQMLKSQSILLSKQVGKIRRNVTGLAFQTGSNRFNISNSKITNFLQRDYQHVNDINEMFENILMIGLSKIHSAASSKISDIHIRLLSLQCDIKVGLLGVGRTVPDVKEAHFDSSNILQSCDSESACLLKSYAVLNDIDIYMVNMEQFYGDLVISMQNKIETALNESNSTNK